MSLFISDKLREDAGEGVKIAKATFGIVNVTAVVDDIVRRHRGEAAREVVEELVLSIALQDGSAVEFRSASGEDVPPDPYTVIEIELILDPGSAPEPDNGILAVDSPDALTGLRPDAVGLRLP